MVAAVLPLLLLAQAPVSACRVSDDAAFATSRDKAAQVGGGAMSAAARERRYLEALRGPGGEPVQYKRTGSLPLDREGRTILDTYEVTYPGIAQAATLYLDAYHFDDALMAPKGFVCAVAFGLAPPGLDAFMAMDALRAIAIEQGTVKDFAPIPLDGDGGGGHGILLDSFRLMARAARAAAAAGARLDAANPPRELLRPRMVAVAYPLRCSGGPVLPPASIDLMSSEGAPPERDGDLLTGAGLARVLPGMDLPEGAAGAVYPTDRPRLIDTLRVTYAGGCDGGVPAVVVLPFRYSNGRALRAPAPSLPVGQTATDRPVRVQAVIDLEGAVRQPVYAGGPAALADAAIAAVRGWTAEPVRLNGAPMPTPVVLSVRFR